MSIALVYLARGVDGGIYSARGFFEAYRAFPPGCSHELIIIAKGWDEIKGRDELQNLAKANKAQVVNLPDDGFDWGAYMRLVPQLSHDWICLLNTQSRPRVKGWLKILRDAIDTPNMDVGAVGATASLGTLVPILPQHSRKVLFNTWLYPIRLFRNILFFFFNVRQFSCFPNPHLRSNAFMVRRKHFHDFAAKQKIPRCKRETYMLESGRTSLSMYLTKLNLKLLVAGADGGVFEAEKWWLSGTFRSPGQPNLLVTDKQTMDYEISDNYMKKGFEKAAWGRIFSKNNA